jgi:hypothetical protein
MEHQAPDWQSSCTQHAFNLQNKLLKHCCCNAAKQTALDLVARTHIAPTVLGKHFTVTVHNALPTTPKPQPPFWLLPP